MSNWRRVNKGRPCPICDHPDWCLISADGSAAICARRESGKRAGEAGWLHRLRDQGTWQSFRRAVHAIGRETQGPGQLDLGSLAKRFQAAVAVDHLNQLATSLGLTVGNLIALDVGWASADALRKVGTYCRGDGCWAFPMRDVSSRVQGIRLRTPDGFKFAVKGGTEGLFLPRVKADHDFLLVCEGPTDSAALLDMGFSNVVGRPSCSGGIKLLVGLVKVRMPREVVILADADQPGRRGARNLASVLLTCAPAVRVIEPPEGIKDARAWLRVGGTRREVEQVISRAAVQGLVIRAQRTGSEREVRE